MNYKFVGGRGGIDKGIDGDDASSASTGGEVVGRASGVLATDGSWLEFYLATSDIKFTWATVSECSKNLDDNVRSVDHPHLVDMHTGSSSGPASASPCGGRRCAVTERCHKDSDG